MQKLINDFILIDACRLVKMPAVQSPLRLLFWCKNYPLHERKRSRYKKNVNKRSGLEDKYAEDPGHNQ